MDYLMLICVLLSFVIVINRIRKQDRKLERDLSVIDVRLKRLEQFCGLSELPGDAIPAADPLSAKISRLEECFTKKQSAATDE